MRGEVVLLDQQNAQTAAGRVTRDADAIDTATDHGEIIGGIGGCAHVLSGRCKEVILS